MFVGSVNEHGFACGTASKHIHIVVDWANNHLVYLGVGISVVQGGASVGSFGPMAMRRPAVVLKHVHGTIVAGLGRYR